jgi:hypothetical protein
MKLNEDTRLICDILNEQLTCYNRLVIHLKSHPKTLLLSISIRRLNYHNSLKFYHKTYSNNISSGIASACIALAFNMPFQLPFKSQ